MPPFDAIADIADSAACVAEAAAYAAITATSGTDGLAALHAANAVADLYTAQAALHDWAAQIMIPAADEVKP